MAMKGHQSLLGKIDHGKRKLKLKLNALLLNSLSIFIEFAVIWNYMIHKNLEIKPPIRAKKTPVVGLNEMAPLHRSLWQVHTPSFFPQSTSVFTRPHPRVVISESVKQGIRKIFQ